MIPLLPILAAFIPTLNYGINRVIDAYTGGPKPSNAQEALALKNADVEQLKALALLDNSDGASKWVVNIRALMRPAASAVVLLVWGTYAIKTGISAEDLMSLAEAVIFYLFGDRTQMYLQKGRK